MTDAKSSINVNSNASSNAARGEGRLVGAHLHVQIHAGTSAGARENGLLDTKLQHGLIDKVGLRGAVGVGGAINLSAGRVGAGHGEATVGTGAVAGALAVGAVDKRDVEPELVVGDAVLELRVLAGLEGAGLADLERSGAARLHGLGVLATGGNVDCCRGAAWLDAPDPDVVRAAVADDGIACSGKAGLQSREKDGGLGEHGCDGRDLSW
jgi:hypothetical protein